MREDLLTKPTSQPVAGAHPTRGVRILGVPLGFGASMAGVDMGPAALRVARLIERITELGYHVEDLGDLHLDRPRWSLPEPGEKLKYIAEISVACEHLAEKVHEILATNDLPLVLGGDHSIAIGSLSGVSAYAREQGQSLGLIWFDAHADMNTPETTPSGNIHGMPLAAVLG